jgi:phosphoserine aminotransferase
MRSETVICVAGKAQKIHFLKQEARKQNIILGNGYGRWKNDTFRIANFPAISPAEIAQLSAILRLIS